MMDEMLAAKQRPRLRSYSPLILGYAAQGKATQAFAAYDRMLLSADAAGTAAIEPTEAELAALLRVAGRARDEGMFLRALRDTQEVVLEPTAETWEAVAAWYEQTARVTRPARIGPDGVCGACGGKLLSVDLPPEGAEALLGMVEEIVLQNAERRGDWEKFKAWLGEAVARDAFDVVVDGANVGYFQMNYAGAPPHVNYDQVAWVVDHLRRQGRRPLLVLHARHVQDKKVPPAYLGLVRAWRESGVLYTVPYRSNDDWFWLCATVKRGGRTLVVTNDQMRDHHFQMLSRRTFLRWRERHQALFSFGGALRDGTRAVKVEEPPVFSRCIQGPVTLGAEDEAATRRGRSRWHLPLAESQDWLCVVEEDRQSEKA